MVKSTLPSPEYLRPAQAARMLSIAPRTIREWMSRRLIPYHKLSPRCVLIKRSDIEAMVKSFRVESIYR